MRAKKEAEGDLCREGVEEGVKRDFGACQDLPFMRFMANDWDLWWGRVLLVILVSIREESEQLMVEIIRSWHMESGANNK